MLAYTLLDDLALGLILRLFESDAAVSFVGMVSGAWKLQEKAEAEEG